MKWRYIVKWGWQNFWISLAVFYGIMLALTLIGTVILIRIGEDVGASVQVDSAGAILALVTGILQFGYLLRWGGSSGVSRRSIFVGAALFTVSYSATLALVSLTFRLMEHFGLGTGMYGMLYPAWNTWSIPHIFSQLLWNLSTALSMQALGYLLGAAFYRLGKYGKIVLAAGLPLTLTVVLPGAISLLPDDWRNSLLQWVGEALSYLGQSPYHVIGCLLAAFVLAGAVSWLLVRRAPVKPATASA